MTKEYLATVTYLSEDASFMVDVEEGDEFTVTVDADIDEMQKLADEHEYTISKNTSYCLVSGDLDEKLGDYRVGTVKVTAIQGVGVYLDLVNKYCPDLTIELELKEAV